MKRTPSLEVSYRKLQRGLSSHSLWWFRAQALHHWKRKGSLFGEEVAGNSAVANTSNFRGHGRWVIKQLHPVSVRTRDVGTICDFKKGSEQAEHRPSTTWLWATLLGVFKKQSSHVFSSMRRVAVAVKCSRFLDFVSKVLWQSDNFSKTPLLCLLYLKNLKYIHGITTNYVCFLKACSQPLLCQESPVSMKQNSKYLSFEKETKVMWLVFYFKVRTI